MFSPGDTIVAIATPPGRGGIGVVRLSGPDARHIAARLIAQVGPLEPRRATLTTVRVDTGDRAEPIDRVVATYFPAPASYTGDDVIEISAHGSPVVLKRIVQAAIKGGARLAEPGEFTLRAYLNGRIDLPQAEAVADLVDAVTPLQARAAFDQLQGTLTRAIAALEARLFDLIARLEASVDFPEEGYHFLDPEALGAEIGRIRAELGALLADASRGRLVREGLQVAIVGAPNVGKSSVFNALVGSDRAIVTDVPGTTRDLVTETVDLSGFRVTLVDTAGLRETDDIVEAEGVWRSRCAADTADLVLHVADRSKPGGPASHLSLQNVDNKRLIVANKSDLPAAWSCQGSVEVSAATGAGMEQLRREILRALDVEQLEDPPEITNVRHIALLERADGALARARAAAGETGAALSEEFVLADLQDAQAALEEITGKRAPDEVLSHIFSRFCIGK